MFLAENWTVSVVRVWERELLLIKEDGGDAGSRGDLAGHCGTVVSHRRQRHLSKCRDHTQHWRHWGSWPIAVRAMLIVEAHISEATWVREAAQRTGNGALLSP